MSLRKHAEARTRRKADERGGRRRRNKASCSVFRSSLSRLLRGASPHRNPCLTLLRCARPAIGAASVFPSLWPATYFEDAASVRVVEGRARRDLLKRGGGGQAAGDVQGEPRYDRGAQATVFGPARTLQPRPQPFLGHDLVRGVGRQPRATYVFDLARGMGARCFLLWVFLSLGLVLHPAVSRGVISDSFVVIIGWS